MSDILLPGTAGLPDVLAGKKCTSSAGYMFTGTMTNNGAIVITPSSASQAIPQGYHSGGGSVAEVVVPVANVLAGTTIAGQAGTMVNNGAGGTITPGTTNQTKAAGFWSSIITILGDVALIAANILAGKTIFGVAGTATADATAGASDITSGQTAYVNGAKVTGTSTKKLYANGTITSSASPASFTDTGGGSKGLPYVTVSGLNFPNGIDTIIVTSVTVGSDQAIYTAHQLANTNGYIMFGGGGAPAWYQPTGNAFVNTTGFQLPLNQYSTSYNWYAWGK